MQRISFLSVAAVALLAACADKPTRVAPTEPKAPSAPSLSTSDGALPAQSSVCLVYTARRDELKAELAANPNDTELAARLANYDEFITDSCQ